MCIHIYLHIYTYRYVPLKEESQRSQEDGSESLTIENEDESVHSTIEDGFRDQEHDCIYDLYYSNHHIWFF